MVSRKCRYGLLLVWIASLTLPALTGCAMPPLEEIVDEVASEELPDDTQLQPDGTANDPADLDDALDSLVRPGETPPDGPRTRLPRPGDDTRIPDPPVDDVEEPPADDCLSPDDACCQRAIDIVRRLEQRGLRFTDDGRRGGLIRSTVAESPDCFVGFVFADNQTCNPVTGICEDVPTDDDLCSGVACDTGSECDPDTGQCVQTGRRRIEQN